MPIVWSREGAEDQVDEDGRGVNCCVWGHFGCGPLGTGVRGTVDTGDGSGRRGWVTEASATEGEDG